ncbi:MAG: hypothetical protein JW863_18655 [Chitinispirillaceae bacterium]|nr:hypothetical protein [Chitinispirillaceae bacterium]
MKKSICVVAILISGFYLSASGSLLTIHAGNDFYLSEDRIDTTNKDNDLFFDFGFGLDDIGGSGLSFHTDLKASNAFIDGETSASARRAIDISTGYLDWRSGNRVFGARFGRQLYSSLSFDSYDFDGLSIGIEPTKKSTINLAAGLRVPSPWGTPYRKTVTATDPVSLLPYVDTVTGYKHNLLSNPGKSMVAMLDGSLSMIPFSTLTYGLSLVPAPYMRSHYGLDTTFSRDINTGSLVVDTVDRTYSEGDTKGDFRIALGTDIAPVSFLRFTGSGRYSVYHKGLDRFDARLRFLPGKVGDISVYFLGDKGRIDSTNYFSLMCFKQLHEFGLTANFFSESGIAVQLDYHATSFIDEGTDHFLSFDASQRFLFGGAVLGLGYHGESIRAYGGFSLPFLKVFSLEGNAEFYRVFPNVYRDAPFDPELINLLWEQLGSLELVNAALATLPDEKINASPQNAVLFAGGLKILFRRAGLKFYPRVEYVTNRYYTKDMRFRFTTDILIRKYWSTGGGQ